MVMEVFSHLEGASAMLFKSSYYPNEMVACRRGSPLIIGLAETEDRKTGQPNGTRAHLKRLEAFVASDGAAVVEHTKRYTPP